MNLRDRWRSTSETILIPIGALIASLIVFGIFCAVQGKNPIAIYGTIYQSAFGNSFSWQGTLIRAAPLMLTSLCTALPAMLGLTIIGNEGALIVGGLGAIAVGLSLGSMPSLIVQISMAIAAIICGGLWIAFVGAIKYYRGVNETISSLLMNYIAIALLNTLVEGPMRDPASLNKPSSFPLAAVNMLQSIPNSRVSAIS